ncbi:MAG TPA: dihydropteroate synthase [Flavipsychrobacter sp.]|nr:dihydropteroate synthase [Flavipsychrobacter sp.]
MISKNTLLPVQTTLQNKGHLLDLSKPLVMGILNATPDSFYNKGRGSDLKELIGNADKMVDEGATILDIGGVSTRPGAEVISVDEELKRVIPVVEAIHKKHPQIWLSVDTTSAVVARQAFYAGVSIINDISSGRFDEEMMHAVAELRAPYIVMHMQGTPKTMQQNPQYEDVVLEVRDELRRVCDRCGEAGITDVIIDPGFGFGKTLEHNFSLLRNLHTFRILGKPILAGISRKSMICKALNVTPEKALNGTTALHMVALQQGANILRVHDVKEAVEVIRLFECLEDDK